MLTRLLAAGLALACGFAASAAPAPADDTRTTRHADAVERGRYLVRVAGCNDCHTRGFAASGGNVPEADWLTGDTLGFAGPWGTTYPSNLRLKLAAMDEAAWKTYARALKTRPPMPFWAVNAMSDDDLAAVWAYLRALGPAGEPAPAALPPGQAAAGPLVRFPAPQQ